MGPSVIEPRANPVATSVTVSASASAEPAATERSIRRGWRGLGELVLWLLLVGAAVVGYRVTSQPHHEATSPAHQSEVTTAPLAVTVAPITTHPIRRTIAVVGSLYGWEEIEIAPRVEGRVVAIYKDIGDVVQPGEKLFQIDPIDYELAVAEQERSLELELAKLQRTELPDTNFNPDELPALVKAEAQWKNAKLRHERQLALRRTGGVSLEEMDQSAAELAIAHAEIQQARLDAHATLAAARYRQAALDTARQKWRDTTVTAPQITDGTHHSQDHASDRFIVCRRDVSVGESVRPAALGGAAVFKLIRTHRLKMLVRVPERHFPEVKEQQQAELSVEAYPGETFVGTVARINPAVDRDTRTFQVEVHVDNGSGRLRPGCFAKANLITHTAEAALTVPEEAITSFAGVVKIFLLDEATHTVRSIPVTTGASISVPEASTSHPKTHPESGSTNGSQAARLWVEVNGALPTTGRVVTSGLLRLAEGTRVTIRQPLAPEAVQEERP